jgi:hypothetical protein
MLTTRPIDKWPGKITPPQKRQRARFKAQWGSTMELLESELRHLGAGTDDVLLLMAISEADITLSGRPRASARPEHPGIVLVIQTKKYGTLKFPCDTFDNYADNIRAVALGLNHLRTLDRYGEQYTGWKQLPEPATGREEAARILSQMTEFSAGEILTDPDVAKRALREAQHKAHPDTGGSHDLFVAVQRAWQALSQ